MTLVNGRPLNEFLEENDNALEAGSIERAKAMRNYRRDRDGWTIPPSNTSPQGSTGIWKVGIPRHSKHK